MTCQITALLSAVTYLRSADEVSILAVDTVVSIDSRLRQVVLTMYRIEKTVLVSCRGLSVSDVIQNTHKYYTTTTTVKSSFPSLDRTCVIVASKALRL